MSYTDKEAARKAALWDTFWFWVRAVLVVAFFFYAFFVNDGLSRDMPMW